MGLLLLFGRLGVTFLLFGGASSGSFFIVDPGLGDDDNSGLFPEDAFRSIQRCVESLRLPGDSCNLRAGRYHEEVNVSGIRGTQEEPIVIRSFEDEEATWDGTVPIQPPEWLLDSETGICSAAIEEDIYALFQNDELLTAARWPNALWSDKTIFNNSFWGKVDKSLEYGVIVDDGRLGLASSGINATGAMAILNIGSFNTYVRPVTEHNPGSETFTYNHDMGEVHWLNAHNQYYLEASFALLDNPGEWFYDKNSKVLHMIPVTGECPDISENILRGRTFDYGLTLTNSSFLTVSKIKFFAATINGYSVDHEESHIDHIILDSLQMFFQSSSRRMLQSTGIPKMTKLSAYANMGHGEHVRGKLSITNCTFFGGECSALQYAGENCEVENNIFSFNDWTGHDNGNGGTVYSQDHSVGDHFHHNSLHNKGRSSGVRLGVKSFIEFNEVSGQCWGEIQNDGAGIQTQVSQQNGVIISNNWVFDSPKASIRFDGSGQNLGINGLQSNNVVWNVGGMMVKGDNHSIVNNLALGTYKDDGSCSLCVIYILRYETWIQNNNTVVLNNAAFQADGGKNVYDGGRWPMSGSIVENNYSNEDINSHIVNAEIRDFRPKQDGALTEGSVFIGPYLPGTSSYTYWIPGRKHYKASHPIPNSGAVVSYTRDAVMFRHGYEASQHQFYFGEDAGNVEAAGMEDPEFLYILEEENIVVLPELEPDSLYFWRVDTIRNELTYKGDVWSFYT